MRDVSNSPVLHRAPRDTGLVLDRLVAYQRRHGLDDAALAGWLGIAVPDLLRLALCERPDSRSPTFGREVRRTAAYAGCDVIRLILLLTEPTGDTPTPSPQEE